MGGYIGSKGVGIISGIDASIADLNLTDKAAANGVTEANKVLTADANKDVTAIRNLTATGNLAATGNVTAGGSVTATGTVTRALTRGSIDVGNSSGVSSALAKGAAGTVLTSDGTDLSFAAVSTSPDTVTFPNWASPTNTYTSSGTWSKGSLADDDYIWFYLLGSGGGGGCYDGADVNGGDGGSATLLYGKASLFHGGAYVIGAAKAGNAGGSGTYQSTPANVSTFTLSSANGSLVFSTAGSSNTTSERVFQITAGSLDVISNAGDDFTLVSQTQSGSVFSSSEVLPSGINYVYRSFGKTYSGTNRGVEHTLFGGGNGGAYKSSGTLTSLAGTSEFSGAGGAIGTTGTNGSAPGGGGGGSTNYSNAGGTGAAGNLRVYHV
tara:strand:- start:2082 stop:3221 length:1140 start_codon:yes stop_codon:yes gene_type:complete